MTDAAKDATLTGAPKEEGIDQVAAQTGEQIAAPARSEPSERELEMERIAAASMAARGAKPEPEKVVEPAATEAAPAKQESSVGLTDQLAKQLEDGTLVLDDAFLSRAMVRTKVDGKEELVPASKALGQFQKGAAADVRLSEATRLLKENADLHEKLKGQLSPATTAAPEPAAAPATSEEVARLRKEHSEALYAGDDEKAGQLLDQLMDLRIEAKRAASAPAHEPVDINELAQRITPALKQQLSVDGALTKLFTDYPEIKDDPVYSYAADRRRAELELEGKPRHEAIALAGEEVGKRFGLGTFSKSGVAANIGATTRDEKLAAKERLDEPPAATARATSSTAQLPQSASAVIAEMAAARGKQAA